MRRLLGRLWLAMGFAMGLLSFEPAAAQPSLYHVDQRYGSVGFSITSLGMFSTEGRFARFEGQLLLDIDHPDQSRIEVNIDGNSVDMPLDDEVTMLRSPAYFDTSHYPTERFVSTSIQALSPNHYLVHGTLQIRGVTIPQDLDAVMTERHADTTKHIQWADFVVTGEMRRSAFGMVADQTMVSDTVHLKIRIRLTVGIDPKIG
jgi:polyisoprenoid-binding protein YceI